MSTTTNPALEADPVRRYTTQEMLEQVEKQIQHNIEFYGAQPPHVLSERIEELRREWSMERYLQVNVASLGFATAFLALTGSKKWAVLTCTALGFFLFHSLRGFDPPIPVLRRMGVRTRSEIDRELYALKLIRGDFNLLPETKPTEKIPAQEILQTVNS